MSRWMRLLVVPVGVLTLGLAACSGDSGDSSSSDDGAASSDDGGGADSDGGASGEGGCAVISVDTVADITGEEITETTELPSGCMWVVAGDPGANFDYQSGDAEIYNANLAATDDQSSMGAEAIDGLGDEAFLRQQLSPDGDVLVGETWVLVGDSYFFVRASALGWSDDIEQAQYELAEEILPSIG